MTSNAVVLVEVEIFYQMLYYNQIRYSNISLAFGI